jgi:dUTP pyrophosphatase
MSLKFKRLFPDAVPPKAGNKYAAGIDLFLPVRKEYYLRVGEMVHIDTGIAFEMPKGFVGLIRPRGSALAKGLIINGTIDQDYRGSIKLFISNTGPNMVILEPAKAYAQMILIEQDSSLYDTIEEVKELSVTERGEKMLGSTGNS